MPKAETILFLFFVLVFVTHWLMIYFQINAFSPAFAKAVIMLRLHGRLGYTNRHHHNHDHNLGHLTKSKLADSLSAGSSDDAIFREL